MQVTVSLTGDLDASGGINVLEEQIVEQGRAVMQQVVRQAVQQYEAEQGACPQCGQRSTRRGGSQRRVLLTRFGRVALRLQRRRCRGCGTGFRPADGCLRELGGRNVTAVLAQACGDRRASPGRMARPGSRRRWPGISRTRCASWTGRT